MKGLPLTARVVIILKKCVVIPDDQSFLLKHGSSFSIGIQYLLQDVKKCGMECVGTRRLFQSYLCCGSFEEVKLEYQRDDLTPNYGRAP